jgi:hypothetical protein
MTANMSVGRGRLKGDPMAKGLKRYTDANKVTPIWTGGWFEVTAGRSRALIGERSDGSLFRGLQTEERGRPAQVEWDEKPFSTQRREEKRARKQVRDFGPDR